MKGKISYDLPSLDKMVADLEPRTLHPALAKAEAAVAEAERALERRRHDLAEAERVVRELPDRIQRGEVKAGALSEALRERDACALMIAPAEADLAKKRERAAAEQRPARAAVEREIARRVDMLERVAVEIGGVLTEINSLNAALLKTQASDARGGFLSVTWPCDLNCNPHVGGGK